MRCTRPESTSPAKALLIASRTAVDAHKNGTEARTDVASSAACSGKNTSAAARVAMTKPSETNTAAAILCGILSGCPLLRCQTVLRHAQGQPHQGNRKRQCTREYRYIGIRNQRNPRGICNWDKKCFVARVRQPQQHSQPIAKQGDHPTPATHPQAQNAAKIPKALWLDCEPVQEPSRPPATDWPMQNAAPWHKTACRGSSTVPSPNSLSPPTSAPTYVSVTAMIEASCCIPLRAYKVPGGR